MSGTDIIETELNCSICYNTFEKPKLLKCMHTFCEKCLVGIYETSVGRNLRCPICRYDNHFQYGISSLPTNFIAQNIIEKMNNRRKVPTCHDCVEKAPASKHCRDCQLNLCESCVDYHQKSVRFAGHKLVQLSQVIGKNDKDSRYCTTHKELLKFFCEECNVLVCSDCMVSKIHQNHNIGLIVEVRERMWEELKKMIADGKILLQDFETKIDESSEFQEQIDNAKQKSIETVNSVFIKLHDLLDKNREGILKSIEKKYEQSESFDNAKKKCQQLRKTVEYSETLSGSQLGADEIGKLKDQLQTCYNEIKDKVTISEKQDVNFQTLLKGNGASDITQKWQPKFSSLFENNVRFSAPCVITNSKSGFPKETWNEKIDISWNPIPNSKPNFSTRGDVNKSQEECSCKKEVFNHRFFRWSDSSFQRDIGNIQIRLTKSETIKNVNVIRQTCKNLITWLGFEK